MNEPCTGSIPAASISFGQLVEAGRKRGILRGRGSRWSAPANLTLAADSQPTTAVFQAGLRQIVFRRRVLMALSGTSRWSLVRVPRTIGRDTDLALSASSFDFNLVFARLGRANPGIYRTGTTSGRWSSRPTRLTTSPNDRNPSVRGGTILFERG